MRHPKATAWEERLKSVFDRLDSELEAQYAGRYPLHPSRPPQGTTANPEQSGLFNVGAVFTPGYDSPTGPGYIVQMQWATLSRIPPDVLEQMERDALAFLQRELPLSFGGKNLQVVREGHVFKIFGDLSLGSV
jgi:hypothetical protein